MRISVLPVLFFLTCRTVAGQASPTATQGIRLHSYALGSYTTPTVFGYPAATAVTVGAGLNPFHFGRVQPGVDARTSVTFGTQREWFLGGGPRVQFDFGRLHPYADYLFGYGSLTSTAAIPVTPRTMRS